MRNSRSTGKPTAAEEAWIIAVKRRGCQCCIAKGWEHDPDGPMVEAHHLLSGGIRRGHMHTVGLCAWHHRGQRMFGYWTAAEHRDQLGPALSDGSVPFHAEFGDDDELMRRQRELLGLEA